VGRMTTEEGDMYLTDLTASSDTAFDVCGLTCHGDHHKKPRGRVTESDTDFGTCGLMY
jgi:hypothetical protein